MKRRKFEEFLPKVEGFLTLSEIIRELLLSLPPAEIQKA